MTTRVKKPHNSLQVRLDDLLEYSPITKNQEVTYDAWEEDYKHSGGQNVGKRKDISFLPVFTSKTSIEAL